MNRLTGIAISLIVVIGISVGYAVRPAVKTNLLYDGALLTPNIGVEVALSQRWSVELSGGVNAWNLSNGRKWKHVLLQPEVRYWPCDAMSGHFFALHALGGPFNIGNIGIAERILGNSSDKNGAFRYQGWGAGAGIAYGYSLILGRHWNLEAELGLGFIHARYDIFDCEGCGKKISNDSKTFFLPTKAAINLVYIF